MAVIALLLLLGQFVYFEAPEEMPAATDEVSAACSTAQS